MISFDRTGEMIIAGGPKTLKALGESGLLSKKDSKKINRIN